MQRPSLLLFVFCFVWQFFSMQLAADAPVSAVMRPNILIVTADNLGFGDLPCFRPDSPVIAPNLDRFATEGTRLTSFYTASPTCTVSRACLLTGRIAQRHGLTQQLPGIEGNYGPGLSSSEILISQVLKSAGYATGCFGKWNIGFAPGSRPTERGFDEFLGHASGNIDYYSHVYNQKHDLYRGTEEAHLSGYSTDLFADAAIEFIREHHDTSWFCYLPFNAPHFPNKKNKSPGQENVWQAPDRAFAAYGIPPSTRDPQLRYHAVITALDSAFGRVLSVLDELELAGQTFVFFYSDNGAFMLEDRGLNVASNAPLRDGGITCWEGGIRVAALARWPGQINAGDVIGEPMWSPDLFVTFARLGQADLPRDRHLDGGDLIPVLTQQTRSPQRTLFFEFRKHAALRMGDWKIVRTNPDADWMLFDLETDISEKNNLAPQYPEKVAQLADDFDRWKNSTVTSEAGSKSN